jgi:hypothetical protein
MKLKTSLLGLTGALFLAFSVSSQASNAQLTLFTTNLQPQVAIKSLSVVSNDSEVKVTSLTQPVPNTIVYDFWANITGDHTITLNLQYGSGSSVKTCSETINAYLDSAPPKSGGKDYNGMFLSKSSNKICPGIEFGDIDQDSIFHTTYHQGMHVDQGQNK